MFQEASNKTNLILSSATFYICMTEKCYILKVKPGRQSLKNHVFFQGLGNFLLQKVQSQNDSAQTAEHKG